MAKATLSGAVPDSTSTEKEANGGRTGTGVCVAWIVAVGEAALTFVRAGLLAAKIDSPASSEAVGVAVDVGFAVDVVDTNSGVLVTEMSGAGGAVLWTQAANTNMATVKSSATFKFRGITLDNKWPL